MTEGAQGRYNEPQRSPSITHGRARKLRAKLSPSEILLWLRLRKRTPELPAFRRQHPIGPYVADFYCSAARLVVKLDGASHGEETRMLRDETRDLYMTRLGYRVLRISAAEVMAKADEVAEGIVDTALGFIRQDAERGRAPFVTRKKERAPPPP